MFHIFLLYIVQLFHVKHQYIVMGNYGMECFTWNIILNNRNLLLLADWMNSYQSWITAKYIISYFSVSIWTVSSQNYTDPSVHNLHRWYNHKSWFDYLLFLNLYLRLNKSLDYHPSQIIEINAPNWHSSIELNCTTICCSIQVSWITTKSNSCKFVQIILFNAILKHFISIKAIKPFNYTVRVWGYTTLRCRCFPATCQRHWKYDAECRCNNLFIFNLISNSDLLRWFYHVQLPVLSYDW